MQHRPITQVLFKFISVCLLLLTTSKILIVGYDIDEQYAISMAYRLLQGDFPILEMWEPHQTSAFLSSMLMFPYLAIIGTTTGIVLYLRICGLAIHSLVCFLLYRQLREYPWAFYIVCIYFFSLPKLMFLPEFSNMQLWFLTLAVLCLLKYYEEKETDTSPHIFYLYLAGTFTMLEVLTYPSTILAFFLSFYYILRSRGKQAILKELTAFVMPCLIGATVFLGILLTQMNPKELINLLPIIASDGSHAFSLAEKFTINLQSLAEILCFLGMYTLIALLFYGIIRLKKAFEDVSAFHLIGTLTLAVCLICQLLIWLFGNQYPNYPMVEYFLLPALGIIISIRKKNTCSTTFRFLILVPLAAFLGIVLFTNHPLLVSAPFLALATLGSLIQLFKHLDINVACTPQRILQTTILLWVFVLFFGKIYMIRTTGGKHYTVFNPVSIMREGPALGIIADTETVLEYKNARELIQAYIPSGSKVFYAGSFTGLYLENQLKICTPSTISSPTFDDKIALYFSMNPDKNPDYIICDTTLSDLYTDSWLANYIKTMCASTPVAANDYIIIYQVTSSGK